jgi:hypothetical protein
MTVTLLVAMCRTVADAVADHSRPVKFLAGVNASVPSALS